MYVSDETLSSLVAQYLELGGKTGGSAGLHPPGGGLLARCVRLRFSLYVLPLDGDLELDLSLRRDLTFACTPFFFLLDLKVEVEVAVAPAVLEAELADFGGPTTL